MIAWLASMAYAGCPLDGPPDAPFASSLDPSLGRMLLVELWVDEADPEWLRSILAALRQRGVGAALVVSRKPDNPVLRELLQEMGARGNELVVRVEPSATDDSRSLRRQRQQLARGIGRKIRATSSHVRDRRQEAELGLAGYRTILTAGSPNSTPRRGASYPSQMTDTAVLPPGTYRGECGPDPLAGRWTPAAADRATRALALTSPETLSLTRVGLDARLGVPEDATVMGRWLDEVILPAGIQTVTPSAARARVLSTSSSLEAADANEPAGGRQLTVEGINAAAEGLRDVAAIPRTLPHDLNPTEAFMAFALVIANTSDSDVVRLGALHGPRDRPPTTLTGETKVPRAAIVGVAKAILAAPPPNVPSSLPVNGHLLTSAELLLLFAAAVRGDAELITYPVMDPDPNSDGLGWGRATLP